MQRPIHNSANGKIQHCRADGEHQHEGKQQFGEDPSGHNLAPVENSGRLAIALTSLGHLEAVARAAYRLQIARVLRVALDLLTDAPYVDIDRAWGHESCIAPHRVEQMIAAEDPSGMPRQVIQQAE